VQRCTPLGALAQGFNQTLFQDSLAPNNGVLSQHVAWKVSVNKIHTTLAAAAALVFSGSVLAQTPAPAPKPAPKKPAAAAPAAPEKPLTTGQLAAAERVYVGTAQCNDNKQVMVSKVDGKPGYFKLEAAKAVYTVAPEETDTGAVRLEDKKSGVVWIQIPAKSMLMNAKIGQRVADGCVMSEQKS
jgi:hypothetical protein